MGHPRGKCPYPAHAQWAQLPLYTRGMTEERGAGGSASWSEHQLVQEETGWEAWDQIKVNLTKLWIPSVTRKLESLGSFLSGIITEWDVCGWINLLFNSSQAVLRQLWLSNSTCLISFYLLFLLSLFFFFLPAVFHGDQAGLILVNEVYLESTFPIFLPFLLTAGVLLDSSATLILILNSHL